MFSKKKKKPLISPPSNFEHRVHTGFDKREGKFVGLPLQWASLVGNNQVRKHSHVDTILQIKTATTQQMFACYLVIIKSQMPFVL